MWLLLRFPVLNEQNSLQLSDEGELGEINVHFFGEECKKVPVKSFMTSQVALIED